MASEKEPMQKHTLHLYEGDYERIKALFPEVGAAIVIRRLVRKFLKDATPVPEITQNKELNL